MKNKALYITVRLDIEFKDDLNWEEVKEQVISEMSYDFEYTKYNEDNLLVEIDITDMEICADNETI